MWSRAIVLLVASVTIVTPVHLLEAFYGSADLCRGPLVRPEGIDLALGPLVGPEGVDLALGPLVGPEGVDLALGPLVGPEGMDLQAA